MSYQTHSKTLALCLGVLVLTLSLTYLVLAAWTEPGSLPPGGNVPAPINVGTTTQVKLGDLGVKGIFASYGGSAATSLAVVGDKIGIGTDAPAYKLDINGSFRLQPTATPTAANGVMYYSSGANKFQCYQNDAWTDCIGTGGGGLGGSGVANRLTYFINANTVGAANGLVWDNVKSTLGVGTTTPEKKLTIYSGDSDWTDTSGGPFKIISTSTCCAGLSLQNLNTGGKTYSLQSTGPLADAGAGAFVIYNNTNQRDDFVITSGGLVGIGTAYPYAQLTVRGDIYAAGDVCDGGSRCLNNLSSLSLNCQTATCTLASTAGASCTASCPSGRKVTGGGFNTPSGGLAKSYLSGNGWYGYSALAGGGEVYAVCCKIQ